MKKQYYLLPQRGIDEMNHADFFSVIDIGYPTLEEAEESIEKILKTYPKTEWSVFTVYSKTKR